ncbi:hypothetical protein ACFQWB_02605 [Paenibacillus thermoaerophilus]|uniref:Uncharacterized protein n=1 Tax=Paenibacillus thermoaerophilus TaxID=1215385 RepID=A0ABW2V233_9BACL|nr:hypothetical protein [Paenibacillus thermoaerophilus]TMV17789.1 hypothetical protein FE781_06590 [Paenibacillus thermoaerophilus]
MNESHNRLSPEPQSVSGLPRFGPPTPLGHPVTTAQTVSAAYGVEDGANVVYTTVSGSASSGNCARFNVIDIDNGKRLGSYPLEATSYVPVHHRTADGRVWIGGAGNLFVYSPASKTVTNLGSPIPGTQSIWALTSDESGNVYGGIYSSTVGGRVFRVDAETLEMADLLGGRVDDGTDPDDDGIAEDYVRSIAYYGGRLYAGTGTTNGRVWIIDPVTKEKRRIEMPGLPDDAIYAGKYDRLGAVYGLTVVGNKLFAFFNGSFTVHVYDLNKRQWMDKAIANVRGFLAVTPERGGKVYTSKQDKLLWEIDVETLEERPAMPFDDSIRETAWIEVRNQPDWPGASMVTISIDGRVMLYDPANGRRKALGRLVEGQPNPIQSLETGPDGKLYMSCYLGILGAQYDPKTETFTTFPLGQAEGIGFVGDTAYFGVYPKAEICAWDMRTPLPAASGPEEIFKLNEEQDRPFVVTEGGGKLLIGSIPGYSAHGGALAVYDPQASADRGEPVLEVHRHVVNNQSVAGLLWRNGLVYGSTSIHGGLGSKPAAKEAKLFVWDPATRKTIHVWTPELDFGGAREMISGLTEGPDGLIWAALNGGVFAFDPDTRQVVKAKELYPETGAYGRWRPVHQRWGADGLLYSDLGGKLTVIDPQSLDHRKIADNVQLFALDRRNRVYAASGSRLWRYDAE